MPRSGVRPVLSMLWRFKGTFLILGIIITIGVLTRNQSPVEHQRLLNRIGMDYELLRDGRIWHLLTGTWFQSRPGIAYSMILLVVTGTVFLEAVAGTPAMLLLVVTGDWVATILTALTMRVLAGAGLSAATALLGTPDAGTSALAHAGYGAFVVLLPRRWLKVAVPALLLFTLAQFLTVSLAPAIVHFWATLYGMFLGWIMLRPRLARARPAAGNESSMNMPPQFGGEATSDL